ncbi:unnamed protein product, partial [Ectocarpus sp. 8 AP-2014]
RRAPPLLQAPVDGWPRHHHPPPDVAGCWEDALHHHSQTPDHACLLTLSSATRRCLLVALSGRVRATPPKLCSRSVYSPSHGPTRPPPTLVSDLPSPCTTSQAPSLLVVCTGLLVAPSWLCRTSIYGAEFKSRCEQPSSREPRVSRFQGVAGRAPPLRLRTNLPPIPLLIG